MFSTLQKSSQMVRHGGLRLLHRVLQRCHATIDYCMLNNDTGVQNLTEFVPAFREALSKTLPEFRVMHQCWNRALGRSVKGIVKTDTEEKGDSEDELKVNKRK